MSYKGYDDVIIKEANAMSNDDRMSSLARELGERYTKLLLKEGVNEETGEGTYLAGLWRRRHGGYENVETGRFVPLSEVFAAELVRRPQKPEVKP